MDKLAKIAEYNKKSADALYFTVICAVIAYALQFVAQILGGSLLLIFTVVSLVIGFAAFIFAFIGFKNMQRSSDLLDTAFPNTGKNFFIAGIVFAVLYVVLYALLMFVLISISVMQNGGADGTSAMSNAQMIFGILTCFTEVFSLNTLLAVFAYRLYTISLGDGKGNNFALLTAIVILSTVIITIIATAYSYFSAADTKSVMILAGIIRIASYVISVIFFTRRRNSVSSVLPAVENSDGKTQK